VSGTRCVVLSGGVGGAKLVLGLANAMAPEALLAVVNTGDDFEHLGLLVCPDIDTIVYALAGLANPESGWGRAGESDGFMRALAALGGETWFFLGDGDLAMHVERTRRLGSGQLLSAVTHDLRRRLGVAVRIAPMSDDPIRTVVSTAEGELAFQHYFVRERCRPVVTGFRFEGAAQARPQPDVLAALADPALEAVLIAPSNPYISIDPILATPGLRGAIADAHVPVVAISPILGGRAVKGPTAKMMAELGVEPSAEAVARRYRGLIDGFVLDDADAGAVDAVRALGMAALATSTMMTSLEDKVRLAGEALQFAGGAAVQQSHLTRRRRSH
jgi:LPPG:FO 2-phospho-L-lactate transferase